MRERSAQHVRLDHRPVGELLHERTLKRLRCAPDARIHIPMRNLGLEAARLAVYPQLVAGIRDHKRATDGIQSCVCGFALGAFRIGRDPVSRPAPARCQRVSGTHIGA